MLSEMEMPELSQHMIQEGIQSLVESVKLEQMYYVIKGLLEDYCQWKSPEDMPLTKTTRNKLVKDDKLLCENCSGGPWDFWNKAMSSTAENYLPFD